VKTCESGKLETAEAETNTGELHELGAVKTGPYSKIGLE
jgi:hypothetical protein